MTKFSDLLESQMRMLHRMAMYAAVIMIGFSLTMWVSSCTTEPHITDSPTLVQAGFMEAETLINNAKTEIMMLRAKASTGVPLTPDEAATLARTEAWINSTSNLLQDAQARAAAAGRALDAGDLVQGGFSAIGGPIGIIGGLISGAMAETWRTRKKRTSFDALVKAIDSVKKKNAKLADAMNEAGPEIRNELGTTARGVVDAMRSAT